MKSADKILWGEGLFLRPQHFQQQDLYHETRLHDRVSATCPFGWGVRRLQVDRDALRHGRLQILDLAVVMPDGELYDAPDRDPLPPEEALADLSAGEDGITFNLVLANLKSFGSNLDPHTDNSGMVRYRQISLPTRDIFTQAPEAEIAFLKKQPRLIASNKFLDGVSHFPLLRLRRSSDGGLELDPDFLPPILSLRAAPALLHHLKRLQDVLHAKIHSLHGHHREPSRNVIEFRSGDISSFWLLHTASQAAAVLLHYRQQPDLHPERLFERLLHLAGGLLTFSKKFSLADLPSYDHSNPGPGFGKLFQILRELLDTVISSRYLAMALREVKPSYHQCALQSEKIDEKTVFFLAVSADIPPIELIEAVPLRFKVGTPDDVDKLVLSAMPGIRLMHALQTPAALPIRPDTHYFSMDSKGPLYERMLQSQLMTIYAPSGIPGLQLELYAITP